MQPSLRKALTSNYVHKVCSFIIGVGIWGIVSSLHEDTLTLEIPLCFYSTQQQTVSQLPQGPAKIMVTLQGRRSHLRQLDKNQLAAHVNITKVGPSGIIPQITDKNLLLPKSIKVVEYKVS